MEFIIWEKYLIKKTKKYKQCIPDILICLLIVLAIKYVIPVTTGFDITEFSVFDPVIRPLENFYLSDFYFSRFQNLRPIEKDSNIILVNIGEPDRLVMAQELEIINKYKPRVIALDVIFRNSKDSVIDSKLAAVVSKTLNLVLAGEIYEEKANGTTKKVHYPSIETFSKYGINSHVGLKKRIDNKAYCFEPIVYTVEGAVYSMPVVVAELFDNRSVERIKQRNNSFEIINFRRNIDNFTVLDVADVLNEKGLGVITGKIVVMGFLGVTLEANSAGDRVHTPLNKYYTGNSYPDMYGAVVIANIISMILNDDFINSNTEMPEYLFLVFYSIGALLALLVFLAITLTGNRRAELWRFAGFVFIIVTYILLKLLLMFFCNYMLYLPDLVYYIILAFIIFEAYTYVFSKRFLRQ